MSGTWPFLGRCMVTWGIGVQHRTWSGVDSGSVLAFFTPGCRSVTGRTGLVLGRVVPAVNKAPDVKTTEIKKIKPGGVAQW